MFFYLKLNKQLPNNKKVLKKIMATQGHISEFNSTFENWKRINFNQVYREELGTASFKNVKVLIDDLETKLFRIEAIKDSVGDNLLYQIYVTYNSIIAQLNSLIGYDDETQFVSYKSTPRIEFTFKQKK
jgi:hypothetical protein